MEIPNSRHYTYTEPSDKQTTIVNARLTEREDMLIDFIFGLYWYCIIDLVGHCEETKQINIATSD